MTGISQAEVDRARLLEPRCSVTLSGWQVIIPVDSGKVAAIIRNLLDNALHAAGPGGGILVALKVEGGQAVPYVADSCPGVPAADWERIFERLIRLDDTRSTDSGGSGLGLDIARGYARAHGGELTCAEPDAAPPCRHRQPYRRSLPPSLPIHPAGPALSPTRQSAREPFMLRNLRQQMKGSAGSWDRQVEFEPVGPSLPGSRGRRWIEPQPVGRRYPDREGRRWIEPQPVGPLLLGVAFVFRRRMAGSAAMAMIRSTTKPAAR